MKPFLERLALPDGASWATLNRRLDGEIPFQWHHHPEFELTMTLNSRGQRFIGDHIGNYDDGDLVLVGPNLPHSWCSAAKVEETAPHVALVMWFLPQWAAPIGGVFTELRAVAAMLERARTGLKFSDTAAAEARPLIEALFGLPPDERLIQLLRVLALLSRDAGAEPLASPLAVAADQPANRGRIDRVLDHVHRRYAEKLSLEALADIAALSPSGLHRLFLRHTGQSVTGYLARLRIGAACALLSGGDRPIATIAADVGYDSLANFNRQFKAQRAVTPRQYRQRFRVGG
ncbi:AraC family transcriptional regulator [Kaistia nematophila]|uniref:AraC family transcriptional regulator n=1 Tax=Kaistia nematophila TaxID=2994654 RepID=A0A9X3E5F8_9HYPH|nr:AraC family transcriptional regulator [Kaistia nematophila]MCX5572201.1 AraC family transcriptional regulator [Kaistia nematophila]